MAHAELYRKIGRFQRYVLTHMLAGANITDCWREGETPGQHMYLLHFNRDGIDEDGMVLEPTRTSRLFSSREGLFIWEDDQIDEGLIVRHYNLTEEAKAELTRRYMKASQATYMPFKIADYGQIV